MNADRTGRWLLLTATGLFVFLFWSAWRYYLERTAIADSAFMSFLMLDAKHPVSFLGRYGSWLPQLFPLVLIHLGASLEAVLRSYSLMFVLFHALVFWLIAFRLKDRTVTLVLLISLCAGFHYTFYYGISELYQGLSVTLLAWAVTRKYLGTAEKHTARWMLVGMVLLNSWAAVYHQLLVCPAVFLLGYEVIERKAWRERKVYIAAGLLATVYFLRIMLLSSSAYEQDRIPSLHDLLVNMTRLGDLASTKYFMARWTMYKALLILLCVHLFMRIRRREFLALAWSLGLSVTFLVFVLITDRDGGSPRIYENYIPLLGTIWAVDLSAFVLSDEGIRRRWRSRAAVLSVLVLGCLQIHRGHFMPSAHVRWAQRITGQLAKQGTQKALVHINAFPWAYAWGIWPTAFETALISGVNGPHEAVTVFVTNATETPLPEANKRYVFLGPEWAPLWFTSNHFNRKHFKFAPGPYRRVTSPAGDSLSASDVIASCALRPVKIILDMVPDRFTITEVEVTNNSSDTLHALLPNGDPVRLAYRIFDDGGVPYQLGDERTALEMDVLPGTTLLTGMAIERPVAPGTYTAEVGLVGAEGTWKPQTRFSIRVGPFGF